MASLSLVALFAALENQIGKPALHSGVAAYLASSHEQPASPAPKVVAVPPVPGAPVKIRKPQSEETKAAAALKRAATKAAKAIAAEPSAVAAEPSAITAAPVPVPAPVPAPPADASVTNEKPKKALSEEHKAKLKAGREAALARKAAAAAAAEPAAAAAAEPAAEADADGHTSDSSSTKKHRGPKSAAEIAAMSPEERAAYDKKAAERKAAKAAKAAAMPLPASPPPVAPVAESHHVFAPFAHKGVNYLRNKRGDLLTAPDADDNGGYEWVGRYDSAKSTINTLFPKPTDLEEE
jgi:hypothetical protein